MEPLKGGVLANNVPPAVQKIWDAVSYTHLANPQLHNKICPSKPLEEITGMIYEAGEMGFKKAITIILGLGEKPEDLKYLFQMIESLEIHRVIFYSLNPHPDTPYANTCLLYTSLSFPKISSSSRPFWKARSRSTR